MKLISIKLLLAIFPFLFLTDNNWKIKSSTIAFKIKNAGISVDGSFSGLEAEIKFNPMKPEEANIKAVVNSKSISTKNEMRDSHLQKPEYFDTEKFPKIILQSTKIEKTGPISYNGTFKLTMKGVTKDVIIPFNFMRLSDRNEIKGSFALNRRDYGVGGNSISMADNLTVTIVLNVIE
jgi:polyisoprenoid-binding protein YceI